MQLLSMTSNNIFIDNGTNEIITNLGNNSTIIDEGGKVVYTTPMLYNYSGMNPPSNFNVYLRTKLSQLIMLYKQAGNIIIMLFVKNDEVIPEFQFSRLTQLFTSLIPPELRITTFLIRDSSIFIYQSGVGTTITNNVIIDYGTFDVSSFDSGVVFN